MTYANQNGRQHQGRLSVSEKLVMETIRAAGSADRDFLANRLDLSPEYIRKITLDLFDGGYLERINNPTSRRILYRVAVDSE